MILKIQKLKMMQTDPLVTVQSFNVPPQHRTDLVNVCEESLRQSLKHLRCATRNNEPLCGIIQSCVNAFTQAVAMVKQNGQIPTITSGHDSHNLEAFERTSLERSLSNIYGFLNNPDYERTSPHSVAGLKSLQPIEKKLFDLSLSFST